MPSDHLGIFDTPPDRREIRFSIILVVLLFVALGILLVQPDVRLHQVNAFIPMVNSIIMVGDLITATLLFVQASVFRSRALTVLASGYVFAASLLVAHALSFPGAFAPKGLLGGGISTTAWIAYFWRAAIPVSIIFYVLLRTADSSSNPRSERAAFMITLGISAAIAAAGAVVLLTTRGHDLLPSVFLTATTINFANTLKINWALIVLLSVATILLYRQRSSVLDMWLLVALASWIAHALLNLEAWGRFTFGFYSQFGMLLFSHFVVMIALIVETNRLYARLALSTAARRREREARLMSMDAVTAAIAHEVGQPLTAVNLNASAAANWLNREKPDVKKALTALGAVSDAGRRTFDIIKSIRATFAKEPGRATEFNLNDLVHETASLLDRELTASKVTLQLELDNSLPPIRADRIQIQRVLINLFTNAIESLRGISKRPRRIAIRSTLLDGRDVLLQVSDTGAGIEPEQTEHIFDAFYTTKATGTGLGLPLCRTIVEDHGGRLWASPGDPDGAVFHLRLPRSGEAAVPVEGTERLLTNLEDSLRLLRQAKSEEVTNMIGELQHIVDEVRGAKRGSKGPG